MQMDPFLATDFELKGLRMAQKQEKRKLRMMRTQINRMLAHCGGPCDESDTDNHDQVLDLFKKLAPEK